MSVPTESRPAVGPDWDWGDRLRKIRRTIAGISQTEMADLLGIKKPTYGAWEGGTNAPTLRMAIQIARKLEALYPGQVSAAWILGSTALLPRMDSNHQPPDWRPDNPNPFPDLGFHDLTPVFTIPRST